MTTATLSQKFESANRLAFLHIPKTGGNTLVAIIDQKFQPSEICPEVYESSIRALPKHAFSTYRLIRAHFDYDCLQEYFPNSKIITFLRHPFARLKSLYEFWRINERQWLMEHPGHEKEFRESVGKGFYDFICYDKAPIKPETNNSLTQMIVGRSSMKNLTDNELLALAQKRLSEEFIFFGIMEKFDESIDLLNHTLNWPPIFSNQKLNALPDNKTIVTPEIEKAILERNQLDMALYQYAHELFINRYRTMTYSFLQRQYQRSRMVRNVEKKSLELEFNQDFQGQGWYQAEKTASGLYFRWSGPELQSTTEVDLPFFDNLKIQIYITYTLSKDIAEGLKINVSGHELVTTVSFQKDFFCVIEGVISKDILSKNLHSTRITFRYPRVVSPKELGMGTDSRSMGLAFHKIIFQVDQPSK